MSERFWGWLTDEERAKSLEDGWVKEFFKGIHPGDGLPGKLEAYQASTNLTKQMAAYSLTAHWFARDPVDPDVYWGRDPRETIPGRLPFLLHAPKRGTRPVPLVLYYAGTGEVGTDLAAHFRQATIFSKLTSPAFQKDNPCYVFAPMLPDWKDFRSGQPESPTPLAALVNDAMYAVIRDAKNPPVDTNRLYVTGLSFGGGASVEMMTQWPGRFAACVPVESFPTLDMIPGKPPGNYWFIYNERGGPKPSRESHMEAVRRLVTSRGGDCRIGRYPDEGHDAWSKAWQEDAVWRWVFSKTADGRRVSGAAPVPAARPPGDAGLPTCTASVPGADERSGPERGVDGLDATCYISSQAMGNSGYWQAEYPAPRKGRVTIHTGTRDGRGILTNGRVEVSANGRIWTRIGGFSSGDGTFTSHQAIPFRFLRIVPTESPPKVLIVRRVEVEG